MSFCRKLHCFFSFHFIYFHQSYNSYLPVKQTHRKPHPRSSLSHVSSLFKSKKESGVERSKGPGTRKDERERAKGSNRAHNNRRMTSRANLNGEHGPPRRQPPAQPHHQHYYPTSTSANLNGEHGPPPVQPRHQHYYPTTSANLNGEHESPRRPPRPAQPHHHDYYPTTSSSASFKGCCCCLFLLFSFLALLILAVVLVIILAVKPKKPSFDLQQVGVQYMGINTPTPSTASAAETNPSTNPTTSASLSLNIRMLFTAVNPNRVGIKYGESKFTVMYRGIPLGKASVPGFFQEAHSVRQVDATIAVDRVNLLQADAADLVRDASLNDRVELRVLGDVGAKIRVLNFDSPGVQVSVDCAIVISPRKQSLTYKQCGFDGLSV